MYSLANKIVIGILLFVGCTVNLFSSGTPEQTSGRTSQILTIYSPHEKSPATAAVKEFQEVTGIQVNLVLAGTGEFMTQIRSERQQGIATCDVLWGGGAESVVANLDLFEPYFVRSAFPIDTHDKASDGFWVGESPVPLVIIYNTVLVQPSEVPTSWDDLLDAKWKGRIAFGDPSKSGSAYTALCTMLLAFDEDWNKIRMFFWNLDGKILEHSAQVYQSVADGQCYVGVTQEKSAISLIRNGEKIAIVYPQEGTSAVDDAIAIVQGTLNREAALRFVEFLLSRPNQEMMSRLYNRRPVRTDIDPPLGLPMMSSVRLLEYDVGWAADHRDEFLSRWTEMADERLNQVEYVAEIHRQSET